MNREQSKNSIKNNTNAPTEPVEVQEQKRKEGYKETKLGWIPEDWEIKTLGDLSIIKGDYGINAASVNYDSKLPTYLRITDISENGKFLSENKRSVNDKDSEKFILSNDDIVFARTGATVGKTYRHKESNGSLIFAGFLIRFRVNLELAEPRYIESFTRTNIYQNWVRVYSVRSGQPGLNSKEYCNLSIPLPPLPEQQKIVRILSTWDKAIAAQEKLITQKQLLKKGLMQQLLTGKKRFPGFEGEWEEVKLEDVCDVKGKYGINAAAVQFSKDLPRYLRITDIDDNGNYSPEKEVSVSAKDWKDFVLEEGDIVFARTGNTTGKSYLYQERDGVLVYAGFLIKFKPISNKLNANYLKFFTQTRLYWNWVKTMSVRSGQPGINSKEYSKLKLELPSIEEQEKMISFFKSKEKEIETYQTYVKELKTQKRGLMQQLLTGEKRVEI